MWRLANLIGNDVNNGVRAATENMCAYASAAYYALPCQISRFIDIHDQFFGQVDKRQLCCRGCATTHKENDNRGKSSHHVDFKNWEFATPRKLRAKQARWAAQANALEHVTERETNPKPCRCIRACYIEKQIMIDSCTADVCPKCA